MSEPQVLIRVRDNGPYKLTGLVRIVDVEGRESTFASCERAS